MRGASLAEPDDEEANQLRHAWGVTSLSHLACCIKVLDGDIRIEIPRHTRNHVQESSQAKFVLPPYIIGASSFIFDSNLDIKYLARYWFTPSQTPLNRRSVHAKVGAYRTRYDCAMVKGKYSVLLLQATAWILATFGPTGAVWAQPNAIPAPRALPTKPEVTLRVTSGLGSMAMFASTEVPFWTQELARLSGGKYTARINRYDQAGIPEAEMLKLIELGVTPFGTAMLAPSAHHSPELALPDLAGMNPDAGTLKHNLAIFRPYLEKLLHDRYGVKLLALYSYPQQVLFCKNPIAGLADLAGRRVRVSSNTQSDFVEGLGGIPVNVGFLQISTNISAGDIECAIMAAASGNLSGVYKVTHFLYSQPISWSVALFGANQAAWNDLPPDLQTMLTQAAPQLEAKLWAESQRMHTQGMACNQGLATCDSGKKGSMTLVAASQEDKRQSLQVFTHQVLPKWLSRCNFRCKEAWNATFGAAQRSKTPHPTLKP